MWDVLSADFDAKISNKKCLENVLKNIQPGSIVVFHDSLKSYDKLRYVLPKVLDFLKINNINCESITL
jgi:predicted O-methyltransferase YrrM